MYFNAVKHSVDSASTIILDIEGTTTSINYVKYELFPYASCFIDEYVKAHWHDADMTDIVNLLINDQEKLKDLEGFIHLPPLPFAECVMDDYKNLVVSHLKWQQANDFKTTGLKKLQGYIWKKGYLEGTIRGHIYDDVPAALKYWKKRGKRIFIYSSGSINAQKLLFGHSKAGDLDQYIDGNFDTTIGSKIEPASYLKLVKEVNERPENIVFFTDRPKEVAAAKEVGMFVVRMVREDENKYILEEKEFLGKEDATVDSFRTLIDT